MGATDTILVKKIGNYTFGVEVRNPEPAEALANGARGYNAQITFYRDGACIGDGAWDPEGFVPGGPSLLPGDRDDSDAMYALATEVRGYLARLEPRP